MRNRNEPDRDEGEREGGAEEEGNVEIDEPHKNFFREPEILKIEF